MDFKLSRYDASAYHGPLTWFMLHPQSPNQDIAMEFLKYYSEHPDWRSAFELHPDAQSDKYPEALAAVYREVAQHYCLGACSLSEPSIHLFSTVLMQGTASCSASRTGVAACASR